MNQRINSINGCITPEAQASYLSQHGHLEGIVVDDHNRDNFARYYTMNGAGYKVVFIGGTIAQISKMTESAVKSIIACSEIKFGGF